MRVIATTHDEAGQPVSRHVADHESMPITDLQAQHLALGLEVVITASRRFEVIQPLGAR